MPSSETLLLSMELYRIVSLLDVTCSPQRETKNLAISRCIDPYMLYSRWESFEFLLTTQ
jgi:hypothetical protein